MKDIEARVERGPVAQNEPSAIGMAKLLEREGKTVAAAELRRLHAENEALKKAVALLQQHHATAWNRGHTMGMEANEDTARRALEAVKQDAWGNTMLTEALLKAEAQRDALLEALKELTPPMPPADAPCHVGLVPQEKCAHCGRIARARAAIASVEETK